MTVNEMLKGIAIASGNDASVAVAEHIAGSEEGFVNMMNKKGERFRAEKYTFSKSNRSSGQRPLFDSK